MENTEAPAMSSIAPIDEFLIGILDAMLAREGKPLHLARPKHNQTGWA
jgi:hypothetical protein